MMSLVFATANSHKVKAVQQIIGNSVEILGLEEAGLMEVIPETGDTFTKNAFQKARYIYNKYSISCFAEDSGLEIQALGGEPGVHTAHYAGDARDADANMNLVLNKMQGYDNRKASFVAVIALILKGQEYLFEGKVNGRISREKKGIEGFGYDPIFIPEGYDRTFAELGQDIKNTVSHRAMATRKLAAFLEKKVRGGVYESN